MPPEVVVRFGGVDLTGPADILREVGPVEHRPPEGASIAVAIDPTIVAPEPMREHPDGFYGWDGEVAYFNRRGTLAVLDPLARRITLSEGGARVGARVRSMFAAQLLMLLGRPTYHGALLGHGPSGRGVLVVGPSHAGKSTLAGAAVRQPDWLSLADDNVVILPRTEEPPAAVGATARIRLRAGARAALTPSLARSGASFDAKDWLVCDDSEAEGTSLAAMLHLIPVGADEPLRIAPLAPTDALMLATQRSFLIPGNLAAQFDALADVADRVPAHELHLPRRFDVYPGLFAALADVV